MLQRYHVGTTVHTHDGVQCVRLHRHHNQANPKDRSLLTLLTYVSVIFIYLNFEEGCLSREKKITRTSVMDRDSK
jgi:hypothetical protein